MSAPAPSAGVSRRTARETVGFVVGVAVCTAVFTADPTGWLGVAAYVVICLGTSAALARGLVAHRPRHRLPWLLLASAPLLGAAGMALRLVLGGTASGPLAFVPDLLTIPAYLLLIAGLLSVVASRRGASAGSAVDGGLMGLAALMLSWTLLIRPLLVETDLPVTIKILNGLYPALSATVLFIAALLVMTDVARVKAAWGLLGGMLALLVGDVLYAAAAAAGMPMVPMVAANVAYCLAYGLVGAAGLDPSMVALVTPAPGNQRVRGYGNGRFAAVAVALLVPAVVVGSRPLAGVVERTIMAGLLCTVGVLVLVRTATAVNRHAASERRLAEQARRDALTGLPNRFHLSAHLEEVIARARTEGRGLAVLFLDLDEFKTVNDTWGHPTGDVLLREVGSRLSAQVRRGELVARVGGDEFVIVAEDVADEADAVALARRLLEAFDTEVDLGVTRVGVGASLGVVVTQPAVLPVTAEDLLRDADTAMYRAKDDSDGSCVVFAESMRVELTERLRLENDLRDALTLGEITLHYQPIVDLDTGSTTGFEALMRWTHPERGSVRPDVFIPVAEETGLIAELGRWAIEEAGARLREWSLEFGGPLSMSVNLSPRQMHDPELVPTVARVLAGLPLPPSSLALEITETSLIEDATGTADAIFALKDLGVRLSADDFGTGYSSLAYLRRYPFDQVKVDRSFVAGLEAGGDDEVIVAAVLSMARALSLTTVAEGVETAYQRDRLAELGAHSGQGWLFARALPAEQAAEHLARTRGRLDAPRAA